jgi:hypothetical protein
MRKTLPYGETGKPLAESAAPAMPADRALLTSRETAKVLKISPRTLSYWTAGGRPRLCYVKFGKAKRFVVADVLRFIEERRIRST